MDSKGYYKLLGVEENASDKEISKAFKKASLKYHPDRMAGKSEEEVKEAEEKFKEINEAYSVLSDKEKRENYDRFGDPDGRGGFDPFGDGFNPFGDGFNPFNGGFNPFGGRAQRQHRPEPVKGSDVKMTIPLTIEEIYLGCKKKLKYKRQVRCKNCHGDGGSGRHQCPHCHGSGMVVETSQQGNMFIKRQMPCHACGATGYTVEHTCPTCKGSKFMTEDYIVEVDIPAGIPPTYAVVKEGEGNQSSDRNGQNGDFLAIASYAFDTSRYDIRGIDISEKVEIPYYDILLGTEYEITLPNGEKRKINIPSCTENGKSIMLFRDGIKAPDGTVGDYYIDVVYKFPSELSEEERKKLESIRVMYHKQKNNH